MADQIGQNDIRGIDIQKTAVGFAEIDFVFKDLARNSTTSAREIRWYQKTAGVLTGTATSTITFTNANMPDGARPFVVQQSWTRNTSYVRKYFWESETISDEDWNDSDPDVQAGLVRDIVRGVVNQVDTRIWNVLTESQSVSTINSVTTTSVGGDQWDAASGQDPIKDIERAKRLIRANGYKIGGGVGAIAMNSQAHEALIVWLISTKGSSIPAFASQKVESGAVMEILGLQVIVSENATSDYAAVFIPGMSVAWKEFMGIKTAWVEDPGIGRKLRVWTEGEALLEHPKSVTLIIDLLT